MGFQVEEVLEKIKMGFDPQKSFTEMNKNGNVKDRIWGQIMCLNPPMMKKISEEIRSGDSEATQNMRLENHGFIRPFMRNRISYRFPPVNHFSRLEKIRLYKT